MRLRVHVYTAAPAIPWEELHRPGRSLLYSLLDEADRPLAEEIHAHGWGPRRMAPFGFCPPVFPTAARRHGVYAAGGPGWLEIGTPVPGIAGRLAQSLTRRRVIDWGGIALRVNRIDLHTPPDDLSTGRTTWTTSTPITLRNTAPGGHTWLLPGDNGWEGRLGLNLRRKAETLGLPQDLTVCALLWHGAKRAHTVASGGDGKKRGARARVVLRGHPDVLRALWCWGLGEATAAGFGWVENRHPVPDAVHHIEHRQETAC